MQTFAHVLQGILARTHRQLPVDTAYRLFMDPKALRQDAVPPELVIQDLSSAERVGATEVWQKTHEALQRPEFATLTDQAFGVAVVEALRSAEHLRRSSGGWAAVPEPVADSGSAPAVEVPAASHAPEPIPIDGGQLKRVDIRFAPARRRFTLTAEDARTTAALIGQLLQKGCMEIQMPPEIEDRTTVTVRIRMPATWGVSLVDGHIERRSKTRGALVVDLGTEVRRHLSRILIQAKRPTLQTSGEVRVDLGAPAPPVETTDARDISGLFDAFDRGASTSIQTTVPAEPSATRPARLTSPGAAAIIESGQRISDAELLATHTAAWTALPTIVEAHATGYGSWIVDVEGERRWTIFGRHGKVVDIVTDPPDMGLDLLRLLTAKGWIKRDMADAARKQAAAEDECVARVLIDHGWLSEERAERAEHARLKLALQHFGLLQFKRYTFTALSQPTRRPVSGVRVAAPPIRSAIDAQAALPVWRAQRQLKPLWAQAPRLSPARLQALALTPEEVRAARLMDGTHALAELETRNLLAARDLRALVLALEGLGLLEWVKLDSSRARVERLLPLLEQRLTMLRTDDPFEGLGLHWSSHFDGIRVHARQLARELELDYVRRMGTPDEATLADRVQEAIEGAVTALDTRRKREAIRHRSVTRAERHQTEEHLVNQGKMLVFRGEFAEARDVFRRVLELNPTHPVARHQIEQLQGY